MVLTIATFIAIGVYIYLSAQHYQLKLGLSDGKSLCNLSSTFNCDTVAISKYATLYSTNIPMAILGLVSHAVFLILLFAARFELSQSTATIRRTLFWLALFMSIVSVIMGAFSSLNLKTYCLFCIAGYILSFIQLFGTWKIQKESPITQIGEDLSTLFSQAKWVLILIVAIPVGGYVLNSITLSNYGLRKLDQVVADALAYWETAPAQNFNLEDGLTLGNPNNPTLTIVEFADFLCPHCKTASPSLQAFTQSHPDVRMLFKVFALDGKCNKAIQREGDGVRCRLSAAVLCADQLSKKGWDAEHWVFERQEDLARNFDLGKFTQDFSGELGLDKASLEQCMNSDSTQSKLLSMGQEGANAKIQGTPTVFVNGKQLDRGQFLPVLEGLYKKLNP